MKLHSYTVMCPPTMAQEAAAEAVMKPISDPKLAFETRCTECHDYENINKGKACKKTEDEWLETIQRMNCKRPKWIYESELQIITEYVLANYFKGQKK